MNCTRMRVVISASITTPSGKKLQTIETSPTTSSEICGNGFDGWSRPNALKKAPSLAAAEGRREQPSRSANTEPKAAHTTAPVHSLRDDGDDEPRGGPVVRRHELAPGHDPDYRQVDQQVDDRDQHDAEH